MGDTPMEVYFAHFTNIHFHNLTATKSIPAATTTILGFGLKFIPIPKNPSVKLTSMKPSNDSAKIST